MQSAELDAKGDPMHPTAHERTILETLITACTDALKPLDLPVKMCDECGTRPAVCYARTGVFCEHHRPPLSDFSPLVSGGPVPKPGEISEAAIVREGIRALGAHIAEIKDWIAEHDARFDGDRDLASSVKNLVAWGAKVEAELASMQNAIHRKPAAPPAQEEAAPNRLKVPCGMCTHEVKTLRAEVGDKDREITALADKLRNVPWVSGAEEEIAELRAALKAEEAAHAETRAEVVDEKDRRQKAESAQYEALKLGECAKHLRIRILRTVRTDCSLLLLGSMPTIAPPGEYPAWINAHGAVCAILPDGQKLGVKPGEFVWIGAIGYWVGEPFPDIAEARAQARAEAIEEAARAAYDAEDPVSVYRLHDGRVTTLDDDDYLIQRRLCAAAIRALAPAQKGGDDA